MVAGAKNLSEGIMRNTSLESLNIKGNVIGDQGMVLLAKGIAQAPNIRELDISLNEIGPDGFEALC
jgi:Ran GTPase-activating protein (RanGAP) involved in mRNA processing and transport